MASVSETEFPVSTCENLNNGHVFKLIASLGIMKATQELLSFERCPEGLSTYAFHKTLPSLKRNFLKLRKRSYDKGDGAAQFQQFSKSAYVYPPPAIDPANAPNKQ